MPLSAALHLSRDYASGDWNASFGFQFGLGETGPLQLLEDMNFPALASIAQHALEAFGVGCPTGKARAQFDVTAWNTGGKTQLGFIFGFTSTSLDVDVGFALSLTFIGDDDVLICFRLGSNKNPACLGPGPTCSSNGAWWDILKEKSCPPRLPHCLGQALCVECTEDLHCSDRSDGATSCNLLVSSNAGSTSGQPYFTCVAPRAGEQKISSCFCCQLFVIGLLQFGESFSLWA